MSELLRPRGSTSIAGNVAGDFDAGHAPGNKGLCFPADPPKVEEIIAVMRTAGDRACTAAACAD